MRLSTLYFLVMSLFLLSCASKQKNDLSPEEKQAQLYYDQGTRELVSGDYTLALQKLIKAHNLRPNDSEISNNLGMAYYFKEDVNRAKLYIQRAIKLDDENADAKLNLATIYMREKDHDKARRLYLKLIDNLTYLGNDRTYYNLALIELNQQNANQAIKYLNQSVEINPNYCPSFYLLGDIAKERKQYKKALDFYKSSSMGTCYDNFEPHMAQVNMMIMLKHYEAARLKLDEMHEKFAMSKYEVRVKNKITHLRRLIHSSDNIELELSKRAINKEIESSDF